MTEVGNGFEGQPKQKKNLFRTEPSERIRSGRAKKRQNNRYIEEEE